MKILYYNIIYKYFIFIIFYKMATESKESINNSRRAELQRQIWDLQEELKTKQNLEERLAQLEKELAKLNELDADKIDNSKEKKEGAFRNERERKINGIYRYIITKEDGSVEIDKEKLKDGKIIIWETEYPELWDWQTWQGYKIVDNRIIIGCFNEEWNTSWETIIIWQRWGISIWMMENWKQKWSWFFQKKDTSIVTIDENWKERIVKKDVLSNSHYWEFLTKEKNLNDEDEINISSQEDLKKYTKDKKILAIYDERYFREKTLSLKYFDNRNKAHRIKKAEKVWEDKIDVTYTEWLEKSPIGKTDWLFLFIETNKSEKVNRVKEDKESKENDEKLGRERKLNEVYGYIITKEDGSVEIDKEKLKDGKIIIWETEYPELWDWQTWQGYKIVDNRIIIGRFNEEWNTSWETIILADWIVMIWEMENWEKKWEWIKQNITKIITINWSEETWNQNEDKERQSLESSQYWKFDSMLLWFNQEIEIKSKAQLKQYVKDQDIFNEMSIKYNDEYFETKSLSVKWVASPKSERENLEIKKVEKVWNKVDVTYETNVYTGITPSIAWTCLFVEINKWDEVNRIKSKEESGEIEDWENKISEETMERINSLKECTIFADGLVWLDKEKLQDNKLKIWDTEYSERIKGSEWKFYELIESKSVSKEWKEYTMGTKLIVWEYDKYGNPKWEIIMIDSNWIITVWNILPESLPRSS